MDENAIPGSAGPDYASAGAEVAAATTGESVWTPMILSGPTSVCPTGASGTYTAVSYGYFLGTIYMQFRWGDGTPDTVVSGRTDQLLSATHVWDTRGTFPVQVRARWWYPGDVHVPPGWMYTAWSAPYPVQVSGSCPPRRRVTEEFNEPSPDDSM